MMNALSFLNAQTPYLEIVINFVVIISLLHFYLDFRQLNV